jgi:hypothetical protein
MMHKILTVGLLGLGLVGCAAQEPCLDGAEHAQNNGPAAGDAPGLDPTTGQAVAPRSRVVRPSDFDTTFLHAVQQEEPGPDVTSPAYLAAGHLVGLTGAGRTAFDLVRVRDSWPSGHGVLGHFELGGDTSGVLLGASAVDRGAGRYFFESSTQHAGSPGSSADVVLRGANIQQGVLTSGWTTGELAGVVYDPATGLIYALQYDPTAAGRAWFTTVNPNTGARTHVTALDLGPTVQGVQAVEPGHRYFVMLGGAQDTGTLVGLDVVTGAQVTTIPTMELGGMEYDGAQHAIYALHGSRVATGTTDVIRVDLESGAHTVVATVSGSAAQGSHAYSAASGHFFFIQPVGHGKANLVVVDTRAGVELGRITTREVTGLEFDGAQFPPL